MNELCASFFATITDLVVLALELCLCLVVDDDGEDDDCCCCTTALFVISFDTTLLVVVVAAASVGIAVLSSSVFSVLIISEL